MIKVVAYTALFLAVSTLAVAAPPPPAPEINPGAASNALAALFGAGLLIRSRRK